VILKNEMSAELDALRRGNRLRARGEQLLRHGEGAWIDVSSNDYLALGKEPVSRETLEPLIGLPTGAGASRLIHGTHPEHAALEAELASWTGFEAALLFSSGYAANVGCISALAGPDDLIVSDALNHASTIDGCRLSRAELVVVPHRNLEAIERALAGPSRRRWVLTESYFSMDADSPDLPGLRALCTERGAGLIIDEAHALGVFGPEGSGLARAHGVEADVLIGTLGKAAGFQGAFVAAADPIIDWLWNRSRSFVFSTAPSPLVARLLRHQLGLVRAAEGRRKDLRDLVEHFALALDALAIPALGKGKGPIFPIVVGDETKALSLARGLQERGILTQAIRPPTVASGTARLRIALHAALMESEIQDVARALGEVWNAS
jgi:8-amino-7-oxononanoate synthase